MPVKPVTAWLDYGFNVLKIKIMETAAHRKYR
jgi:hypothetical protein